eukprot:TRINITY_DN1715_c0_g4_i1.p1 TRINITY_DN1715_c0_g4~~TRINITY_DN1715_c0_g4_i1.p1  ORF type:complete len:591 (+),score=75.99 TRINITY_DN1715_c0_g4_i1:148-1920(+)
MGPGKTFWRIVGIDCARHSSSQGCQRRRFIQTCVVFVIAGVALNKEEPPIGCINSSFNVLEQLHQRRPSAGAPGHMNQVPLFHAQDLQECSAPKAVLAARTHATRDEPPPTNRSTANLWKANSLSHDANIVISRDVQLGKTKWETEPSGVLVSDNVFNHDEVFHDGVYLMQVTEVASHVQGHPDLLSSKASANGNVSAIVVAPSTRGIATDENDSYLPSQANTSRIVALELSFFSDNQTSNATGDCVIGAMRKHLVEVLNKSRQKLSLATTWVSHVAARRTSTALAFALVLGLVLACTMGTFLASSAMDIRNISLPRQHQNERLLPSGRTKGAQRRDSSAPNPHQSPRRDSHLARKPPPPIREPTDEFHAPPQKPAVDASEAFMGLPPLCPSLIVPESSECVLALPSLLYDLAEASLPGPSAQQDLQRSGSGLRVNTVSDMDGRPMFRTAFGNDAGDVTTAPWLTLSGVGNSSIVAIAQQTANVRGSLTVFDELKRPFGQLVVEGNSRHGWIFTLKPVKGEQVKFHSSDSNMDCRVVSTAGELLALVEPVGSDPLGFRVKRQATFGPSVDVGLLLLCLLGCDWLKAHMTD